MSEQPPPIPYAMPYQTPQVFVRPNPRPVSVTVLAVLAIVFGGLGSLCGWANLLPYLGGPMQSPVTEAFRNDAVIFPWVVFTAVYGWAMAIVLLVGGIQSLRLRPIGRTLLMTYAWASLIMAVPGVIMNFMFMMPALKALQSKNPGNPAINMAVSTGLIAAIAGLVIGLAVVAYVLFVLTRPHVKAAFAAGGGAGPRA